MGGTAVRCGNQEFQVIVPPSGQECLAYLEPYTLAATGYAQVLDNGDCGYCVYASGDQFLATLGMSFSHRWRDVGLMCAYIIFNIFATFVLTYLVSPSALSLVYGADLFGITYSSPSSTGGASACSARRRPKRPRLRLPSPRTLGPLALSPFSVALFP